MAGSEFGPTKSPPFAFFFLGLPPCLFNLASAAAARSARNCSRSSSVSSGLCIGFGSDSSLKPMSVSGDGAV